MKKVLFVCTANVCRSPMAQELFNALAHDGALPFRAESAGTAALEGRPMAENALAALEEAGIYPEAAHSARRVSAAMIGDSELVLAMTPEHAVTLRRIGGGPLGDPLGDPPRGIHVLPEYASGVAGGAIADPHGLTMAAHRSTLRQLYEHIDRLLGRLEERASLPR